MGRERVARILVVGKKPINFNNRKKFRAIIGSTKANLQLRQVAFNFARKSVLEGYIVVSGLARGIDTEAHKGALSVEGDFIKTMAILSTSPSESIYPRENYQLAQSIKTYGALIHPYRAKAEWRQGVRFGQPQKRLVERDVIQAVLSGEIYAVSDDYIQGGTRWALNYGRYLGIPSYVIRSSGEITPIQPEDFKQEPKLIPW